MNCKVICMNDSIEYVMVSISWSEVLFELKVAQKLDELKQAYWDKNKGSFTDHKQYDSICYWHTHTPTVEVLP